MTYRNIRRVVLLIAALPVLACNESGVGVDCVPELVLSSSTQSLNVGDSAVVTGALDCSVAASTPATLQWQVTDSSRAVILPRSNTGAVMVGRSPGEVHAVATTASGINAMQHVTVVLGRDTASGVQTDALKYEVRDEGYALAADIVTTFINRSSEPVYIVNCNGHAHSVLQRWTGFEWQTVWSGVPNLCLSAPIVVPASGMHETTVYIRAAHNVSTIFPEFVSGTVDGVYRLQWPHFLSSFDLSARPFGEPILEQWRVSNPFVLEEQS